VLVLPTVLRNEQLTDLDMTAITFLKILGMWYRRAAEIDIPLPALLCRHRLLIAKSMAKAMLVRGWWSA
jgi:hypothetical protein